MKKRILKWTVGILLAPIVLFFILAALLYIPAIQDFTVRKATAYASEATGMNVHIGQLRLTFLFDISLQNVQVSDPKDILLDVEQLTVDLSFSSILHGEIDVEGIELTQASVDTKSLIKSVAIRGHIGHFYVDSHGIKLPQETVTVSTASLSDADVDIALGHSESTDTTSSAVNWKIILPKVDLTRTRLRLSMPGDSMRVEAGIAEAALRHGLIDLGTSVYTAKTFGLQADSVRYDLPHEKPAEGLDVNHIALRDVGIGLDSVRFDGRSMALSLNLREMRMKEKSGLEVTSLTGTFRMDSTSLHVPALILRTPDSYLRAQADMDFSAVSAQPEGNFSARVMGELGKQDILLFAGGLPPAFVRAYPNAPVVLRVAADGNMDKIALHTLEARLADAFTLKADGELRHLADSIHMGADIGLDLQTRNLNFVKTLAGTENMQDIAIPHMRINGTAGFQGQRYTADLQLREGKGTARMNASFDAARTAYEARMDIDSLQLHHFLPNDSLYHLSLTAKAEGRGTDFLNRLTRLRADVALESLRYGHLSLSGIRLAANLENGKGQINLTSNNPLLRMASQANVSIGRRHTALDMVLDMKSIDLYALGVSKQPFATGLRLDIEGGTNLKNAHSLHANISDIALFVQDTVFHPKNLDMNLLATPDTTYADISAGDFKLRLNGRNGYETLMKRSQEFITVANQQLKRRHLDQDSLRLFLPSATLSVVSGKDNPIYNYLATAGYKFEDLRLALDADPGRGLNGGGHAYALTVGNILLDTIQMHIFQDSTGVKMDGRVRNGPQNKQFIFESKLNAYLHAVGAGANLTYVDEDGKTGVDLGLRADVEEEGIRLVFSQAHPIIAYRRFDINENNYVFLGNDRRVEADIKMQADDGTGARVYSTPNPEALQDLSVNLYHFNVGELMSVIPYAPRITGMLAADAHLIQTEEDLSVVADLQVKNMAYENAPLGNIGLSAVYLPNEDGTHFVDARVARNDAEVLALSGAYKDVEGEQHLQADLTLSDFPLALANGFVPDHLAALEGLANGNLEVKGSPDQPDVEGWLSTKGLKINSSEYSLALRLADDTIRVAQSKLSLDELNVYSSGKNPLVFDGTVDFSDFSNILLNLQVNASNFELINAKRTQQAAAYGKVYVDVNARMSGNLNYINIGGRLGLLGSTDVTYVLKDSPLSSEDRLSGLVTFVDFSDTTAVEPEERAQPMNMNVMMQVSIDQGAQVHCLLSRSSDERGESLST